MFPFHRRLFQRIAQWCHSTRTASPTEVSPIIGRPTSVIDNVGPKVIQLRANVNGSGNYIYVGLDEQGTLTWSQHPKSGKMQYGK